MRGDDLPLFAWTPPAARVIAFPADRRIGKIRRVVEVLSGRSGKGFDRYWSDTVTTMRAQMETAGLLPADIDRELEAFATSVQRELDRRFSRNSHPDGAA